MTRLTRRWTGLALAGAVVAPALAIGQSTGRSERPVLPAEPYSYADVELPAHVEGGAGTRGAAIRADNMPADNPVTDEGATLGRVLFYDTRLSANGTVSCGTCHRQEHGFSAPERLSVGLHGETTARHSMGLANARFYRSGRFFWDQRAATLEQQVLVPIQDPIEMAMDLDELTGR
ncbi:MAG: cytochrome-c peroxidase, partial [Gemmatimonadota bacterium]|nr:cytochrome-c peroxidase [Gemmatimonadota bacterium]